MRWNIGLWVMILCVSCKARTVEESRSENRASALPREETAKPEERQVPARETASPSSPVEPMEIDVASGNEQAPWGGLKVHLVGEDPKKSDTLVLLLHGYGAEGDDLVRFSEEMEQGMKAAYVLPEAPFRRPEGGRAWFGLDGSRFDEGLSFARGALRHALSWGNKRVFLGGFSQGAMISMNLLRDLDQQVRGVLLLSGADLLRYKPLPTSPRPAIFLSHGKSDRVLPFTEGLAIKDRLDRLGYDVTWVDFEGRHQIPATVRRAVFSFLDAHSD